MTEPRYACLARVARGGPAHPPDADRPTGWVCYDLPGVGPGMTVTGPDDLARASSPPLP
jgi:hypothetical protein